MRRAFDAYARWRGDRPERHASFAMCAALTVFALVVFPAQDLPVLVEHDVAFIDLSLVLLAAGTAAALTGLARRGRASLRLIVTPTLLATVLVVSAGFRSALWTP